MEKKTYKDQYMKFGVLFILFFALVNISAAIFMAIERNSSSEAYEVYNYTEIVNNFTRSHNISEKVLDAFLNDLASAHREQWWSSHRSMSFMEGFVLAMSLFTTIGWGHVTPFSFAGGLFTVLISCIGIPITFIMLISGGNILIRHLIDVIVKIIEKYGKHRMKNKEDLLVIPVLLIILILYVLITSAIIAVMDDFQYEHAIYYTFISLSTIGLGDINQGKMLEESDTGKAFGLALFFFLWIIFGLMFVAATVNAIGSYYNNSFMTRLHGNVRADELDDDNTLINDDGL